MADPTTTGTGDGTTVDIHRAASQTVDLARTGPATLSQVMHDVETEVADGNVAQYRPLSTGFDPLDDILNGGLRRGELMVIGGAFGVGKTIFGLQVARNVVLQNPDTRAMYICYEHDRDHLMSRLMCLESAERGEGDQALTLRRLAQMALDTPPGTGLISHLRRMPRHGTVIQAMDAYGDRLVLVKASGDTSSLDEVERWVREAVGSGPERLLVVVDYLQKIPVRRAGFAPEDEITTRLTQGLKEMAMSLGIQIVAIAASDRPGLKAKRMRLSDLRGSSALQYEADIGLIMNNKWTIVSREHLVFNPNQAQSMRDWVVFTVEKNRAGRNAVDMEFPLDAAHFRFLTTGRFVRERLIDEKVALE